MIPTARLRFIERFVEIYKHDNGVPTGHSVRILQQWWLDEEAKEGKWRDVPVEDV